MLSKLYKKNLFKKYNGIIFIRGGDHHSHGGKPNAHHNEHHDHHGEHHDDHHDHHDDHHHNPLSYGAGGTWYEIFGGKKYDAPRRYNIHGERIVPGQKRQMKFYEMPIYLGVGLSIAITLGFLYFFPYESKNEWAREEIRIRRDKRSSESEETKTARRQMVSSFLAESTTQVKLDKVASPSVWLDSSFDKFLENKSLEIMSLLQRPNTTEDILSESKILEEGYTVSQNLKLRNDSNKEIDLLQYLISSSGNDLSDTEKINSQLKQDLLKNNNLRDDLQLGINVSPSNQLIYDREFCSSFNNVLQMRIASHDLKTVSSKGFTI